MNKIKKGDTVAVLTGRDRGKRGTVVRVYADDRVVVEGINLVKRHTRPNPQAGIAGGIVEKEAPLQISNVALYNPMTRKPDRVGIRVLEDGRKVRFFKSNGEVVDVKSGSFEMTRLEQHYRDVVTKKLIEQFSYGSAMQVPRITKVTLNMGLGEAVGDKKIIDHALGDMKAIAGQQPVVCLARKSIAGFKIREEWPIGCKVTLRRSRMYEFLDRLINIAIPRIRDFRGLNGRAFDGRGNYSMGIKEQIIFPEVDYDKIDVLRGMDICITTTARTDEEGRALLEAFRFPLRT